MAESAWSVLHSKNERMLYASAGSTLACKSIRYKGFGYEIFFINIFRDFDDTIRSIKEDIQLRKLSEEKLAVERERLKGLREIEEAYLKEGYDFVLGVDEVGRGPLCGPVVTACCLLPEDAEILFLNDSKKLSEKKRELLYDEIREKALAFGFGERSPEEIDGLNILNATLLAMRDAVLACAEALKEKLVTEQKNAEASTDGSNGMLKTGSDTNISLTEDETAAGKNLRILVLVDGDKRIPDLPFDQQNLIKGDGKSAQVAAASILAKVKRDRMMYEYDKLYPQYGFAKNKGYGTREHVEALKTYGVLPIHRRSFLKKLL